MLFPIILLVVILGSTSCKTPLKNDTSKQKSISNQNRDALSLSEDEIQSAQKFISKVILASSRPDYKIAIGNTAAENLDGLKAAIKVSQNIDTLASRFGIESADYSNMHSIRLFLNWFSHPRVQFLTEMIGKDPNVDNIMQDFFKSEFSTCCAIEVKEKIDQGVEKLQFSSFPILKQITSKFDLSSYPEVVQTLINKILTGYFDGVPIDMKKAIIARVLAVKTNGPETDVNRVVEAVKETGPIMKKLFQMIGKTATDPQMLIALKDIKANLPSLSVADALGELQKRWETRTYSDFMNQVQDLPNFGGKNIVNLGAASVGQVMSMTMKDGTKRVIKLRHIGLVEAAQQELTQLNNLLKDNEQARNLINKIGTNVLEELDFRTEADNYTAMVNAYSKYPFLLKETYLFNKNDEIFLPNVYQDLTRDDVLVVDQAQGDNMGKVGTSDAKNQLDSSIPDQVKARIRAQRAWNVMWLTEGLMVSGFMHADPHSGNMMLLVKPDGSFKFTPIDLGSIISLNSMAARGVILYGIGVKIGSQALTQRGIGMISKDSKEKMTDAFKKDLAQLMKTLNGKELQSKVGDLLAKYEIDVQDDFVAFFRANEFMEEEMAIASDLAKANKLTGYSASDVYRGAANLTIVEKFWSTANSVKNTIVNSIRPTPKLPIKPILTEEKSATNILNCIETGACWQAKKATENVRRKLK